MKLQIKPTSKFEAIYKEHRAKILNFIAARVGQREDAEDLTEEVFIKVYKKLPDFKWQGVSIESWIFKIARNTIIDFHRKYAKEKNNVDIDVVQAKSLDISSSDALANLLDDEEQFKLYKEISEFEPEEQYLIYYKYFEELSVSEIAIRLNLSETNVGTKLFRLRKKLLKSLTKSQ